MKVGTDCAELNACEHNVRPTSLAVVDEAGTITTKPSTSSVVGSSILKPKVYVGEDVTPVVISKNSPFGQPHCPSCRFYEESDDGFE